MTRTFFYLIFGLLTCCGQSHKSNVPADSTKTTLQTESPTNTRDTIAGNKKQKGKEEDCVFNSDYKGLTTEWLADLKINDFIWRDDLEQALIPRGQDTVFISKGGCDHFGLMVELKLTNDNHALTDSSFWINKALNLATQYKMEHYEQMIRERKIRLAQSGNTTVWYEIEDKSEPDNLEYDGVEITQDGLNKRISISQYYN